MKIDENGQIASDIIQIEEIGTTCTYHHWSVEKRYRNYNCLIIIERCSQCAGRKVIKVTMPPKKKRFIFF